MKKSVDFEFFKDWFVFPFAISVRRIYEFYYFAIAITFHFMWWHCRFLFIKQEGDK